MFNTPSSISSTDVSVAAGQYNKEKEYWLKKLAGNPGKSRIPYSFKPTAHTHTSGVTSKTFDLTRELVDQLMKVSGGNDFKLYVLLLSTVVLMLEKYSRSWHCHRFADILVGTTVLKQNIESRFINTLLVLRNPVAEDSTFKQLVVQVRQTLTEAIENQNYPLITLPGQLNISHQKGDFPLFDVAVLLENLHDKRYLHQVQPAVLFLFSKEKGGVQGICQYKNELYNDITVDRIIAHFTHLLQQVLLKADQPVSAVDMVSEEERKQLVMDFNATELEYPRDKTLHRLFAHQVERNPHHAALMSSSIKGGTRKIPDMHYISYRELNRHSHQLAQLLKEKGMTPDTIVGLMVDRSIEMFTGIMGILKAGGAYLPLNPLHPAERLTYMLKDSEAKFLLSQETTGNEKIKSREPGNRSGWQGETILLTTESTERELYNKTPVNNLQPSATLAYVIYTSGSTGKPKGVIMAHQPVCNLVFGLKNKIYDRYTGGLRVGLVSPYEFDGSAQNIFGALALGHCLFVVPEEARVDGSQLMELYRKYTIDISDGTPTHIRILLATPGETDERLNLPVKHFLIAGEALPPKVVEDFLARCHPPLPRVTNLYGPTETCVDSTFYHISPADLKGMPTVPIGKPLPNEQTYILDRENRLQPIGVAGELCVGGDGLARGYLNRPEYTAEKFDQDLWNLQDYLDKRKKIPGKKNCPGGYHRSYIFYRTGDLARWLPDGNIEFIGRIDHQIKIRGYRIELGEIENQLLNHEGIKEAVVVPIENERGDKSLCAYYVEKVEKPVELWPSVGEYFVWDDFLYYYMTHDTPRNQRYVSAINRLVKDKVVVEIGTGRDAVLARFCARAGAKTVYAIEILEESYQKAKALIEELGLAETIRLIHGDAASVQLPEKADVCVSQIIGNIGSSEGVIPILNKARRFLKKGGVMIPKGCDTKIAAVYLPQDLHENPEFTRISRGYAEKILRSFGYPFDFRVCINNFPRSHIVSTAGTFEYLDFSGEIPLQSSQNLCLVTAQDTRLDGFLLWINLETAAGEIIDTSENKYLWSPVFVPVFYPGLQVCEGDTIHLQCIRSGDGMNPDYHLKGKLKRQKGEDIRFDYNLPYHEKGYRTNPFYQELFARYQEKESQNGEKEPGNSHKRINGSQLRDYLAKELPDYMIPSFFVALEEIPLTFNGKVDRKALPGPDSLEPGEGDPDGYVQPRDELEEKLVVIWSKVLGQSARLIGIEDNFFEIGGDSLKATILVSNLHRELDVKVPLAEVFKTQTIKELSGFIRSAVSHRFITIEPAANKDYYPLSSAQKRLYFLNRLDPEGLSYNMPQIIPLGENTDNQRLTETFKALVQRHESLRTSFQMVDEEPVQRIHPGVPFNIEFINITESPGGVQKKFKDFVRPFDLSRAPLIRAGLVRITGDKILLLVDMHHIITDGVSSALLEQEFVDLDNGKGLPPLRLQYKDFAQWQLKLAQTGKIQQQEAYWLKVFEDTIPVLNLPTDNSRPDFHSFEGEEFHFEIGEELTRGIEKIRKEAAATLNIVLLAVYYIFLSKYTGQEDIVVGSPTAGRTHADLQRIIGMFVNMLPLRNKPRSNISFMAFLGEVKQNALNAYENQDFQFDELVERLGLSGRENRHPLVETVFFLENLAMRPHQPLAYDIKSEISKFDLKLEAFENNKGLSFTFEYHSKLFEKQTIQRFSQHFKNILAEVTANPRIKLGKIDMLSKGEKEELLNRIKNKNSRRTRIIGMDKRSSQQAKTVEGEFDM